MNLRGIIVGAGTCAAAIASIVGISLLDLKDHFSPKGLDPRQRAAVTTELRKMAADGYVSADERAALKQSVAALDADSEAAERYLAEVEPVMIEAAERMREGFRLATESRFDEARRRFEEAARLDAVSADAWANLGGAALEIGSISEAEAALRRALELDDDSVTAHYNLGACLAVQERVGPSLDHLARALDLVLHAPSAPVVDRRALLVDLESSPHFASIRSNSRFVELLSRFENAGD